MGIEWVLVYSDGSRAELDRDPRKKTKIKVNMNVNSKLKKRTHSPPQSQTLYLSPLPIQTDLNGAETHLTAVGCESHGAEAAVPIQSETPMPE